MSATTTATVLSAVTLLAWLAASPAPSSAAEEEDTCVACHEALGEPLGDPVEAMKNDIHSEKGLSCVDCHGGDATIMDETSMAPEKGFRGVPEHGDVPAFCGRCHSDGAFMRRFNPSLPTDQLAQYWTSVHGQRLREGDQKVATCVSCHGAHGILPGNRAQSSVFPPSVPATCGHCHSNREYMAEYDLPADQEEKYRRSVHAHLLLVERDLSAPVCNDCHGNHGAFPPGVTSIAEICGQCHVNNAALFSKSPHRPAFDRRGLPECAVCHDHHEIRGASEAMLGDAANTVCHRCHEPGSVALAAAVTMRQAIEELKAVMTDTEALLKRAAAMGMEVSDEHYAFNESVRPRLIEARTQTHLADAGAVMETVQAGVEAAMERKRAAEREIAEAAARRRNLLLPLGLIVVLMVLLFAKLRQLEARERSGDGG